MLLAIYIPKTMGALHQKPLKAPTKLTPQDILQRLGQGESIASICELAGWTRPQFDEWWRRETAQRVPPATGETSAAVQGVVKIDRDPWGIPHIYADHQDDLFFGYGYAMAQDRLFQMDYLRRKGAGRLAEILGRDGVSGDILARTVGLARIAQAEWKRLDAQTQSVVEAFSRGVNTLIEQTAHRPPIEFDLLGYRPEPWSPIDCIIIENEFRWYLTGRFPVIVIPELAKRTLGEGDLYRAFLQGENDAESILLPEEYPPCDGAPTKAENVGSAMGLDDGIGSNNWVISGRRAALEKPIVASDPHIAFEAVSCWYEARLCGAGWNVAGMTYVGMPAILFGRNERVAWGITNNICSQRDLYQERVDPNHPGCFLYDGEWEPAREITETIQVKDDEPVVQTIRFSRNGPIVDEILPSPAQTTGPVALRWLGAHHGGWLTALLQMNRAENVEQFVEAMRRWHVPTFSLVFADVEGRCGYKASGRIPLRKRPERGYRQGWNPDDQWQGLIPFEAMPGVIDPPRGFITTANHRVAADDYPYPLAGTWTRGDRGKRIRQMIESQDRHTHDDIRAMQHDALSIRVEERIKPLLEVLESSNNSHVLQAADILRQWDGQVDAEAVGPTLFNVFFTFWAKTVVAERFDDPLRDLMTTGAEGLAAALLDADPFGWFAGEDRKNKINAAFEEAIAALSERFGDDMQTWQWGALHRMPLRHVLSSRGDLCQLLDHGGAPVKGDMGTVCNTGSGPDWRAATGGGYRMSADLAEEPPALWAIDAQSQSGHVGSQHYGDQLDHWLAGRRHQLSLDSAAAAQMRRDQFILTPQ